MTPKKTHGTPQRTRGRPRILESAEEMTRLVDEYIEQRHEDKIPVTLMGLVLHLGLNSYESLTEYGRRPEFSAPVKRAKAMVAEEYELLLQRDRCAGPIFALKNLGWSDRRELEVSGGLLSSIDMNQLPDAMIERIAAGEHPLAVLASASEEIREQLALPSGSE